MRIDLSDRELKLWIVNKLHNRGYWGHRLTKNSKNIRQGAHPVYYNRIDDLVIDLWRTGILFRKKGKYGFRYSLNPARKKDIDAMIEEWERLR